MGPRNLDRHQGLRIEMSIQDCWNYDNRRIGTRVRLCARRNFKGQDTAARRRHAEIQMQKGSVTKGLAGQSILGGLSANWKLGFYSLLHHAAATV